MLKDLPRYECLLEASRKFPDLDPSATEVFLHLLRAGVLDRQIGRLRQVCRGRRDAMLTSLARHFPNHATWTKPDGGMFLMVTLSGKLDAANLLERAIARGVVFAPGADFHLGGQGSNTLRLNFSNCPPAQIEEGIRRLGHLIDAN